MPLQAYDFRELDNLLHHGARIIIFFHCGRKTLEFTRVSEFAIFLDAQVSQSMWCYLRSDTGRGNKNRNSRIVRNTRLQRPAAAQEQSA